MTNIKVYRDKLSLHCFIWQSYGDAILKVFLHIPLFIYFLSSGKESTLKTKTKCTLWKVLIVPATDYFCVLRVHFAKPLNLVWLMKAPDTC